MRLAKARGIDVPDTADQVNRTVAFELPQAVEVKTGGWMVNLRGFNSRC